MLDIILLGLTSLASITGFASGNSFNTTNEDVQIILSFMEEENVLHKETLYVDDLYTISGENRYLEIVFQDGGYLIYDKKEQTIDEFSKFKKTPYFGLDNQFKIYEENFFDFMYVYFDGSGFKDISAKRSLDYSSITAFFEDSPIKSGNYYRDIPVYSDAFVIDKSFYFEKLTSNHAWNYDGTCTIVALEILLGYYDTFSSDLFVDETYDTISEQYTGNSTSLFLFNQSPGVDNHQNNDSDFHDYLCKVAKDDIHDDPRVDGMSTANQIKLLNKYLNNKGISYTLNTSEGNIGDIWTNRAIEIIKNAVNNNRPVISNGSGHSTVAFSYNDEYVWVHTGWGWTGATPWGTYTSGLFENYGAGAIDLSYTGEHVHSDNYYSSNNHLYICPCGVRYAESILAPIDYGFEPQYFFDVRNKDIVLSNNYNRFDLNIYTTRLRTGYIEEEYINLSPRRSGAGSAFLEYVFDKSVRKFSIDLSYWQIKDVITSGSATLSILNKDGVWVPETNLLTEIVLSTDRTNQGTYTYSCVGNEIYGISISATESATGSRNLGRISIGNLKLMYAAQ